MEKLIWNINWKYFLFQSRNQTAVHLVASRQTGTATAILRALLQAAGKDIRLKVDGVSRDNISYSVKFFLMAYWYSII